jgi:hypothetical protein
MRCWGRLRRIVLCWWCLWGICLIRCGGDEVGRVGGMFSLDGFGLGFCCLAGFFWDRRSWVKPEGFEHGGGMRLRQSKKIVLTIQG